MGVLRFKDEVEEILEKDPYELFQIDAPHRLGRRLTPGALGAAALGVLIAFGVAAFAFWNARRASAPAGEPYAYFEVRALDPDGRPVAGATVREAGHAVGVTDSFGEWRRFMRVKPGTTVMIEISKTIGQTTLVATKGLAVPPKMPESGDLELTGSVQLVRGGVGAIEEKPVDKVKPKAAAMAALAADAAAEANADGFTGTSAVRSKPTPTTMNSEDEAAGGGARALDGASLAIVIEDRGQYTALTEAGAAIKRRARELGAQVDLRSPMRLVVRDLVAPGQGEDGAAHLLQVSAEVVRENGEVEPLFSYLRNYQDEATATARDVLWAATMHAPVAHEVEKVGKDWLVGAPSARLWGLTPGRLLARADGELIPVVATFGDQQTLKLLLGDHEQPCANGAERCVLVTPGIARVAPIAGWRRLKLSLHGVVGDGNGDLAVYVSGFAATPDEGGRGVYSYWGQPGGSANLTVLREGRVALRTRLAASAKGQATATLPFPMKYR